MRADRKAVIPPPIEVPAVEDERWMLAHHKLIAEESPCRMARRTLGYDDGPVGQRTRWPVWLLERRPLGKNLVGAERLMNRIAHDVHAERLALVMEKSRQPRTCR